MASKSHSQKARARMEREGIKYQEALAREDAERDARIGTVWRDTLDEVRASDEFADKTKLLLPYGRLYSFDDQGARSDHGPAAARISGDSNIFQVIGTKGDGTSTAVASAVISGKIL